MAPHMPDNANIILHVYDGKRQLLDKGVRWSAQAIDGRALDVRKTLTFPNLKGGSQLLNVPFFDNFGDNYTIIVDADGFQTAAWRPVTVSGSGPVTADIQLLPNRDAFNFAGATWDQLSQSRPNVAKMIRACYPDPATAAAMYSNACKNHPLSIACFLNLVTAMADMQLTPKKNALDYYWNVGWPQGDPTTADWNQQFDGVMKQDRMFCYVDQAILPDVRAANAQGAFSKEANPEVWGHTGATESYKQVQFDVANVQLTFHGRDTAIFQDENHNLVQCVKIEPDIDYYKDLGAHGLQEVIPNTITHGLTDPKVVYTLRWMATKREPNLPEFNPLYTVEAAA
jgi:hypothetical protein